MTFAIVGLVLLQAAGPPEQSTLINADRPGIADGTGVVNRGVLQVETGLQRDSHEESLARSNTTFLPTLVRFGLGRGWEGRFETNSYSWMDLREPTGTTNAVGWTPASVGVKFLLHQSGNPGGVRIAAIGRVFPESGTGAFASHRVAGDLRIAAEVELSRGITLNPNAGIARYEGSDGKTRPTALLAATLALSPTNRFSPFVDVSYQKPADADGRSAVVVDGGVAYIVGCTVQLDGSLGAGVHGPAPRPFVSFGVSFRLRQGDCRER